MIDIEAITDAYKDVKGIGTDDEGDDPNKERDRSITLLHISPEEYVAMMQGHIGHLHDEIRAETIETLHLWIEDTEKALRADFPNYHVSSRLVDSLGPLHQWIIDVEPDNELIIRQAYRIAFEEWNKTMQEFIHKIQKYL